MSTTITLHPHLIEWQCRTCDIRVGSAVCHGCNNPAAPAALVWNADMAFESLGGVVIHYNHPKLLDTRHTHKCSDPRCGFGGHVHGVATTCPWCESNRRFCNGCKRWGTSKSCLDCSLITARAELVQMPHHSPKARDRLLSAPLGDTEIWKLAAEDDMQRFRDELDAVYRAQSMMPEGHPHRAEYDRLKKVS